MLCLSTTFFRTQSSTVSLSGSDLCLCAPQKLSAILVCFFSPLDGRQVFGCVAGAYILEEERRGELWPLERGRVGKGGEGGGKGDSSKTSTSHSPASLSSIKMESRNSPGTREMHLAVETTSRRIQRDGQSLLCSHILQTRCCCPVCIFAFPS